VDWLHPHLHPPLHGIPTPGLSSFPFKGSNLKAMPAMTTDFLAAPAFSHFYFTIFPSADHEVRKIIFRVVAKNSLQNLIFHEKSQLCWCFPWIST
jgi:hypothetical protein